MQSGQSGVTTGNPATTIRPSVNTTSPGRPVITIFTRPPFNMPWPPFINWDTPATPPAKLDGHHAEDTTNKSKGTISD
ncbi:unnamed protein product [Gordionus sp. m RMFG-2023]